MNFKNCAGICLLLLCLMCCQSCKKGCTNVRAYNYQSSAKEDDGSCLYCDSAVTSGFGQSISVEDVTPGSPYQYNYVIFASVNSNYVVYNGNGCKLQGHDNTGSGCSTTFYAATLQNQTTSTVTFSGTIQVFQYSLGSTVNYPVYNVIIPPNSYVNVNLGPGGCQPQFSSFSVSVLSPTFSYH
jgi:hypothetical protein